MKSSDRLRWATTFANWSLYEHVPIPSIQNTILIYNGLRYFQSFAWNKSVVPQFNQTMMQLFSCREGQYPLSEMTYTLHDNVHVIQSILQIGAPAFNNLFKFERTNLILKRLCKNRKHPIGSIVKNYLISECNFQHLIGDFTLIEKVAYRI
jgi:uncharacterized membrane protein YjdF